MIGSADGASLRTDVLVIGGGAAGAFAALAARERGYEVTVVRRAWGATALSSGAADVAPDPQALPGLPLGGRQSILDAAAQLALRRPDHPYAILRERLFLLPEALAFASAQTSGVLAFGAPEEENRLLLSPLGLLKPAAGGLDSIAAGDLLRAGGTVGIVGFDRIPLIDAPLLARAAEEAVALAGLDLRAVGIECDFFRHQEDPLLRPHELAERLERDPERLIESVRRALPQEAIALLLFPPLLSRVDAGEMIRGLQEGLGIRCAELPAGRQSLPGIRLQRALEARLQQAGIRIVAGEVFVDPALGPAPVPEAVAGLVSPAGPALSTFVPPHVPAEGGGFTALPPPRPPADALAAYVRAAMEGGLRLRGSEPSILPAARFDPSAGRFPPPAAQGQPIEAQAVILATGKFIGGGVRREGLLREPIFDLPIWVRGRIDGGRWLGDWTAHELRDEQHAMRAGVRIDEGLRPLLPDEGTASDRLFACGGVLAGNDPAQDGAGIGLAVFTGYLAGVAAADRIAGGGGRG